MTGTRDILQRLQAGEITIDEAESYFNRAPFEEMDYAKLDTHRGMRSGFPEVVFCQGKADDHLLGLYR